MKNLIEKLSKQDVTTEELFNKFVEMDIEIMNDYYREHKLNEHLKKAKVLTELIEKRMMELKG